MAWLEALKSLSPRELGRRRWKKYVARYQRADRINYKRYRGRHDRIMFAAPTKRENIQ